MNHLHRVAARVFGRPLLAESHYAEVIASILAPRVGLSPPLALESPAPEKRPERMPMLADGGVLIMPVVGGLIHRGDWLDASSGLVGYTYLQNEIVAAMDDPKIRAVLLDIDSPGGEAGGAFELADSIRDLSRTKPIWAIANTCAASGAYLIGAAANRLDATVSSRVGSIGVAYLHTDYSGLLEEAGIVKTFVFAGAHKVDGNSFEPLPEKVRGAIQKEIDGTYAMFVEQVAALRPNLTADAVRATQARVYSAQDAADLGLVDSVRSFAATLDALRAEIATPITVTTTTLKGSDPMSTAIETTPALVAAQAAPSAAQLEEARAAGYSAGRRDALAILQHEAASGRMATAAVLAGNAKVSVDEAAEMLAGLPRESARAGGVLAGLMKGQQTVGAGEDDETDTREQRSASLRGLMADVSGRKK